MRGVLAGIAFVVATAGVATAGTEYVTGSNDGSRGFVDIVAVEQGPGATTVSVMHVLCSYTTVPKPNTNQMFIFLTASATVTSTTPPVSTGVHCRAYNASGGVEINTALPGSSVAGSAQIEVTAGRVTICAQGSVHYPDNTFWRTSEVCWPPA